MSNLPLPKTIRGRDAHARLRFAVGPEGYAGFQCNICERAVVIILEQRRRRGIVGDVDIGPTIVVKVAH